MWLARLSIGYEFYDVKFSQNYRAKFNIALVAFTRSLCLQQTSLAEIPAKQRSNVKVLFA